jgi:outer membrane lipoprotein-sorting protein
VIERPAKDLGKQPLYRILTGQAAFEKEFQLLSSKKENKNTILTLKPKQPLGDTETIQLTVNKSNEIIELLLLNKGENTTRIRLQKTALGGKFLPNLFDFKPPPGTDLVKE